MSEPTAAELRAADKEHEYAISRLMFRVADGGTATPEEIIDACNFALQKAAP